MVRLLKATIRFSFAVVAFLAAYNLAAVNTVSWWWSDSASISIARLALLYGATVIVFDMLLRADRTPWRFSSTADIFLLLRSTSLAALIFLLVVFLFERALYLPRSTFLLAWGIDLGLVCGLRLVRRALHERSLAPALLPFLTRGGGATDPMLLIGGLDHADAFLRDLSRDRSAKHRPLALIVAEASEVGRELRGVPVAGTLAQFERIVAKLPPLKTILFLDETIAPADINPETLAKLVAADVQLLRLSRMIEVDGLPSHQRMRQLSVEELLARPPVHLDHTGIRKLISGKRVLVTGAGGSIGSEICRQVAALGCAHISLVDNSEFSLFKIDLEISQNHQTLSRREILCDVRDRSSIQTHIQQEAPDIVFHAAALKHVPLVERHPCEGVLTNIVGTWNVAEAAGLAGAKQMVFISTDKAVEPSNVMGATKRVAESIVRAHQHIAGSTRFSVVRFGNVLGSAGSVVPIFKDQIERGGPVTVTHKDVERYFMTIPEAVQLVLHATNTSSSREEARSGVFVLDMGKPVLIMDLAKRMIELHGKVPGKDILIQITGLRPGEKLSEELVDSSEDATPCSAGVMEVMDRIQGSPMDRATVKRLEEIARQGDDAAARAAVLESLELVRAVRARPAIARVK